MCPNSVEIRSVTSGIRRRKKEQEEGTRNSSGDETANVNLFNDDIAHTLLQRFKIPKKRTYFVQQIKR